MQISGDLKNNKIIVKKPKDVGRLFNKSHFGKMIKDNNLELNLLEGIFLLGEEKIAIYKNKQKIDFKYLTKIAIKNSPTIKKIAPP